MKTTLFEAKIILVFLFALLMVSAGFVPNVVGQHRLSHQDLTRVFASINQGTTRSLKNTKRIYSISDLHTDSAINMRWLEEKCNTKGDSTPGKHDLLIVAGDIAHELSTLRQTLMVLKELDCEVFFVPGNHEAWLTSHCRINNSFEKLQAVCDECKSLGVHTDLTSVGDSFDYPVFVAPIQGWYDGSLTLDGTEDLCEGFNVWPWTDFSRCSWPSEFPLFDLDSANARIPKNLVDYYLKQNEAGIRAVNHALSNDRLRKNDYEGCHGLISVSHFLPNQQCLPDWKEINSTHFLRNEWLDHGAAQVSAKFAKVAGSRLLDAQIRSAVPEGVITRHLHVFGHSHRPKDFDFNGIRYIHNPLGKPREREMNMIDPNIDFLLVWDTRRGEVEGERVIRFWEEKGGGKAALFERHRIFREKKRKAVRMALGKTESTKRTLKSYNSTEQ